MKSEYWILLAIGGYWLYSRSQSYAPFTYPTYQGGPYIPGSSRSTGSGGTTASLPGGGGSSVNNPPVGGTGNPGWSPNPTGVNNPGTPGYVQCQDGSYASDPSQCPENQQTLYCADGTPTNDLSVCPEYQFTGTDTMDPCDPASSVYDPAQCTGGTGDITAPVDWGTL